MRDFWNIIKGNIFIIVLLTVLVVAMPWLLIFVLPIIIVFIIIIIYAWRAHRLQKRVYEEFSRQSGGTQYNEQSQRSRRGKSKTEGDVTVVQTEITQPRVNDDVGEYVDFKEIKEE